MKIHYEYSELQQEVALLEHTFDKVRVVDPVQIRECVFEPETQMIHYKTYGCYKIWKKNQRCKDCISIKAFKYKTRYTKFEFIDDEVYYVVAKYIEVEKHAHVLEIVNKIDNKVEVLGEGYNEFVDRIHGFHKALYKDELTGTYNRTYMKENLPLLLEQVRYQKDDLGIAVIDIDSLKGVNDTYGHQVGDELIVKVSAVINKATETHNCDFVTRYGGDEFILILNEVSKKQFEDRLGQLMHTVRDIRLEGAPKVKVSISIGGAMASEHQDVEMERLIRLADQRLYKAKGQGKNCIIVEG